ncbi:Mismatch repair protein msh3 [Desmophyllum pertusum]|uniref:DNA mismatch repair protein MSH3 n=1 Tax=Desmophyllum pertusum TaxID=174260 RepID=A0A9W9ZMU1_9CNID|nr:Mismatch repair protein msh3 [Desmophyllum pertusum]
MAILQVVHLQRINHRQRFSSFFVSKPCSSPMKSTVIGNPSGSKAAKRTASKLSHVENNDDDFSAHNSKKQRCDLEDDKDGDHLTLTNKETLSSSTMAKLSCFRKDANDSSGNDNKLRSVPVSGKHVESINLCKDVDSKSSGHHIYVDEGDDLEEKVIKSSIPRESFNMTKFACTSRPSAKSVSKIKGVTEKSSKMEGSKSLDSRTKSAYTPLEIQFLDVKSKYSDVILFVECGYRYRFFGEDAEVAAKELNIMCHMDHNFNTASIPTHRLHVHVKRLVSKGYKVGVVKQTETAALKAAGENKGKVFTRELQALYTKTTLVGEDMNTVEDFDEVDSMELGSGYLMCLVEVDPQDSKTSSDRKMFGLVAVQPSTGDVVYDEFEDGPSYTELESHFVHINPEELLLPVSVTVRTENFIRDYVTRVQRPEDSIRLERMPDQLFDHSTALNQITEFYEEQKPSRNEELCKYLKDFKLEKILRLTSDFSRFSLQNKFLKLSGQTLRNLEIFKNLTNGSEKYSLFWVINHTTTAFGRRLLKKWISQPLRDVSTKQVSRFRTPFVEEKFKLLCQWREQLSITCQEAWLEFLALFSEGCSRYRRAVHHIATLDCLFSLAAVAKQPGFHKV